MNISIQILRAVACVFVVLGHTPPKAVGNFKHIFTHHIGVDIFFIISGFVMATTMSSHNLGLRSAVTFIARRFVRIWPLYALVSVWFAFQLSGYNIHAVNWPLLVRSLTLLPISLQGNEYVSSFSGNGLFADPVLGVGWTLEFEMFFYFIVAFLIIAKIKNPFAPAIIFAIPVYLTATLDGSWTPVASMISSPLLYEFAFGYWLHHAYEKYPGYFYRFAPIPLISGTILALLAMTGQGNDLWYRNIPRMVVDFGDGLKINRILAYGIPSAILVCAFLGYEKLLSTRGKLSQIAKTIGDSSYTLYLIHIPIFLALPTIVDTEHWFSCFVYIVTPVVAAIYLHRYFEKPLLIFLNKLVSKA
jgi:exopolysaccharide production protein ExoZ